MPTTVRAHAPIPLPLEICWQKLRDLRRAKHYVPGVTDCVLRTEQSTGVGASRTVRHRLFGEMDETVVRWDEGEGFTLRLHQGERPARPFREAFFRYELQPAEGGCVIETSMTWTLPGGPIGRLLDALVMRRVMAGNVRDVALCLAEYHRTDQPVPESELPRLRRAARRS